MINSNTNRGNESAPSHDLFPIVGIGASAGGLEAFSRLRKSLPANTGMGFVPSHQLDPVSESTLTKLVAKATAMPMREVANNSFMELNRVYIIPPNKSLLLRDGDKHLPDVAQDIGEIFLDTLFEEHESPKYERIMPRQAARSSRAQLSCCEDR